MTNAKEILENNHLNVDEKSLRAMEEYAQAKTNELKELLKWAHKVINASVPKQAGYGAIEILPQIEKAIK